MQLTLNHLHYDVCRICSVRTAWYSVLGLARRDVSVAAITERVFLGLAITEVCRWQRYETISTRYCHRAKLFMKSPTPFFCCHSYQLLLITNAISSKSGIFKPVVSIGVSLAVFCFHVSIAILLATCCFFFFSSACSRCSEDPDWQSLPPGLQAPGERRRGGGICAQAWHDVFWSESAVRFQRHGVADGVGESRSEAKWNESHLGTNERLVDCVVLSLSASLSLCFSVCVSLCVCLSLFYLSVSSLFQ